MVSKGMLPLSRRFELGECFRSFGGEPTAGNLVSVFDNRQRVGGLRVGLSGEADRNAAFGVLPPDVIAIKVLRRLEMKVAVAILECEFGGSPQHELLNACGT